MSLLTLLLLLPTALPEGFVPVNGFLDLDYHAEPYGFGLLVILSGDEAPDISMSRIVLSSLDSLPECAEVALWSLSPDASGYAEVAALAGEYGGFPATVVLVGHCGFMELDPEFLVTEIIDSWYTWGDPGSHRTGICNFCSRCNP